MRNHIEEALKILLLAAGIIITCVVVAIGFATMRESKNLASSSVGQITALSGELADYDMKMYDGLEVTGSDVINLIKKHLGDYANGETAKISITVKTSKGTYTYQNDAYLANIKNIGDSRYIKPTATFLGKVNRNGNDVITGLQFEQK